MFIHQNAFLGLERIVKMLESKKPNKKNRIHFTMKDVGELSSMSVSILMQLDIKTVRNGELGKTNRGRK